jgi:selenocysteine-specific elongation factor
VRRERRLAALTAMALPDPRAALGALLASEGWIDSHRFALARNVRASDVLAWSDGLRAIRIGRATHPILITTETTDNVAQTLLRQLQDWHQRHPDLAGPGKSVLLASLPAVPTEVAEAVLRDLLANRQVVQQGAVFRLPQHQPQLPDADERLWPRIEQALADAGPRSRRVRELAADFSLPPIEMEAALLRLERFGRLFRVASNRFFLPETVVQLGAIAAALARDSEEGGFTAAEYNHRAGIGRNLTIEILEFFDRLGVTQRNGELRHVLRPVEEAIA